MGANGSPSAEVWGIGAIMSVNCIKILIVENMIVVISAKGRVLLFLKNIHGKIRILLSIS